MTTHATGTFEFKAWDEKTWDGKVARDIKGAKMTHAVISNTYHGDIEGTSASQILMVYDENDHAVYSGLEQITGKLGGKAGSFVLQMTGKFDGGVASGDFTVVPGSGTGDLKGLQGKGSFAAQLHQNNTPYTLDYTLE